jgi:hypothetical protein
MEFPASKMKSEYDKLLSGESETDEEFMARPSPQSKGLTWRQRFFFLLVSSVSLIVGIVGGGAYQRHYISCSPSDPTVFVPEVPQLIKPYSPAPVRYINKFLKNGPESKPFMGHPRPELDAAWHELLSGTLVRFSADELHLANYTTSIKHKEGGYIGGLGISHNLHCLKRIKQYLHPDYYPTELHVHEDPFEHLDHCLESLRLAIMCHGDTNVYALQWLPHNRFKPGVVLSQQNVCVDWEPLHRWMLERAAKVDDMEKPPSEMFDEYDRTHRGEGKEEGHEGMGHGEKGGEGHHEMGHAGKGKSVY